MPYNKIWEDSQRNAT